MREIKFKYIGKNLSDKVFIEIFTIQQIEENEVFKWMKKNNIVPSSVKRNQYTGVKDKNRKEIYEGDLFFDETDNFYLKVIFDIDRSLYCFERWENNEWCGFPSDELVMFFLSNMEIIGNIHENPELLESKNES